MRLSVSEIGRLQTEQRGSVAMIFALLATSVFGMTALAVDVARGYNARNRVSAALDAAALAGAKAMDAGGSNYDVQQAAKVYFEATMAETNVSHIRFWDFESQLNRGQATVTTTVKGEMNTFFGAVMGTTMFQLHNTATVTFRTRNVELAMSLDVTGSMEDNGKISDLKNAAKDVVDTLFAEASSEDGVRISIVPWAASVNAGPYGATVTDGASVDNCAVERTGPAEATDAAPFGQLALPAITTAPYGYNCPSSPVVPLSGRSKERVLKDAIDDLPAYGGTAGHIGTAWGWYTISPAWASIWPTESKPHPYSPKDNIKVVLLMTDGEFSISWAQTQVYEPISMGQDSTARFLAICQQMKQKDIIVYTVGFDLKVPAAMQALKTCATSDAQHFTATDGNDLKKAFKAVATQLKSMRVTK